LSLIWETSSGEVLERWRNGCGEYCEGHAWNWVHGCVVDCRNLDIQYLTLSSWQNIAEPISL